TGAPPAVDGDAAHPQQQPQPDPVKMGEAASQLFRAMDGWGTDENAIHRALQGKSAAEIASIRSIYRDHFPGHDLDADLSDELSGDDLAQAQAEMTADPVQSAATALVTASSGIGTDEEAIHRTLEGIHDPKQREAVAAEFQRRTGTSLHARLEDEMSGADLAIAEPLETGDVAGARAAKLDDAMNGGFLGLGIGTDEDAIYSTLESCNNAEERRQLVASYQQQTGRTL